MAAMNTNTSTTTLDWNTVTSDLQRAANNLVWYVLESMALPEQPNFIPSPTMLLTTTTTSVAQTPPSQENQASEKPPRLPSTSRKRKMSKNKSHQDSTAQAVDRLIAETLV